MIKTIEVINWQSHKKTLLKLLPGLNILAGATKNGKSVIIRAAGDWCLLNDVRGTGFRPVVKDSEVSSCKIEFEDGTWVQRERNEVQGKKAVNGYKYFDGRDERKAVALGSDVPEEIQLIARMNEINIQGQEDDRFLLSKKTSPGEIAKKLNALVGLEIIDKVTDKAKELYTRTKDQLDQARGEQKEKEAKLKTLEYLDALGKELDSLEVMDKKKGELERGIDKASVLISETEDLLDIIQGNQEWLQVESIYSNLVENKKKIDSLEDSINTASNLSASILKTNERLEKKTNWLKVESLHKTTKEKVEQAQEIESKEKRARSLIRQIEETKERVHDNEKWMVVEAVLLKNQRLFSELQKKVTIITQTENMLEVISRKIAEGRGKEKCLLELVNKRESLLSQVKQLCPIFSVPCCLEDS